MKLLTKAAVLTGVGVLLLGTSLSLTSARVSGASQVQPPKHKACDTTGYCLTEINGNDSSGGGIYASGANVGVKATGGFGVLAVSSSGYPIYAQGASGDFASIDQYGDGTFSGEVVAYGGFGSSVRTRDGLRVASAALAPRATIEDSGTARMTEGISTVQFNPDFARTLDLRAGYQVFLTPDGDSRGLYVAQKYAKGFIVRESERGRSTIDFDYRILGKPIGVADTRLPALNTNVPHLPVSQ